MNNRINNRGCNVNKKKCFKWKKDGKIIGFILLIFGVVTICAFFLPVKVWLIVLGLLLIACGFILMKP